MYADQTAVNGENYIGLLGFASDRYAVLCHNFEYEEVLGVPTLKTKAYGTNLVGMFCAGNSKGILLPYFIPDNEMENILKFMGRLGVGVHKIRDRYTALGNMVACNDKGAFISASLTQDYREIEDTLQVEVVPGDIGGHTEVGAYIAATNRGFLAHPQAERHLKQVGEILKVGGMVGTVNCGVPFVRSGLIANSNGYISGLQTTGIEMQRIEEALALV